MESGSTQTNKSKWAWFVFGVTVVALAAMIVVVVWPPLSLKTPADIIVVKAIDGAIKVKPADPGGMAVAHQDLLVIDMLKSGVADAGEVETLQPSASAPEPPPITAGKTDIAAADLLKDSATPASPAATGAESENTAAIQKKTAKAPSVKPTAKPAIKQSNSQVFVIQLAAFRSDEKAREIASLLSEKHSSRLQGMRLQSMRLDTGSNGVFFRVVSAPISRTEAENTCRNLRRAGQDCFLRKFVTPEG
ncbi:SPOR domain-containing protein [Alphaproteobacteria bacterium]|nr:SPOR domain-containing protein [Alphaproteobacteria bacterium]